MFRVRIYDVVSLNFVTFASTFAIASTNITIIILYVLLTTANSTTTRNCDCDSL